MVLEQLSLMEIIKIVIIFVTKTDGNFMFSWKESFCIWSPQQATDVWACTIICCLTFQWDTSPCWPWFLHHFAHKRCWFLREELCKGESREVLNLSTSSSSNRWYFNIFLSFLLWKANPYLEQISCFYDKNTLGADSLLCMFALL